MNPRGGGLSKKAQWTAEYNSLHKKAKILEKEVDGKLFGKKHDLPPYVASLLNYQNDLDKQRATEERAMFAHLEKIKVSVGRLRTQVQNVNRARDDAYVSTLENLMNYIEREVVSFKSSQRERREELNVEEMTLDREASMFERRLENLQDEATRHDAQAAQPAKPLKVNIDKSRANEAVPPEVVTLQTFLQETGMTGGWPEKDHQQFIHIRNQCKGDLRQLIERCVYEIPEKDDALVEDHEQWYNTFTSLLQAQKTAIKRWKTNKETIRVADLQQHEEKLEREAEQARQEQREQQRRVKEERELKLLQWREEQRSREAEEKERALREEERRISEEKEREMRRRTIVKERLQEYLTQKEEEDKQKQVEEGRRREAVVNKVTAKDLERFQEKDRMKVIDKQQKAMMNDIQKAEKEMRLEKLRRQVHVSVPRDPNRLTKPTAAFEMRMNEIEQKALYPNMDFNGPFATRRAIPAWRQGL